MGEGRDRIEERIERYRPIDEWIVDVHEMVKFDLPVFSMLARSCVCTVTLLLLLLDLLR